MTRVTLVALVAVAGLAVVGVGATAGIVYLSRENATLPSALAGLAVLAVQQLVTVVNAYIRSEGSATNGTSSNP